MRGLKELFRKRQQAVRLQSIVMLFCLATMLVVTLVYSARVQKDVYRDYESISMSSLNSMMHSLDIVFRDIRDLSMQLFQDGYVHRFLYEETARQYDTVSYIVKKTEQVMLSNHLIDSVYIAAMERGVVYSSNYGINSFDAAPDSSFIGWYYKSRAQIETVGTHRIVVQKYDNRTKDVISVCARLPMDAFKSSRGALVINMDEREIYASIIEPNLKDNAGILYVLDGDGRVILARDAEQLYGSFGDLGLTGDPLSSASGSMLSQAGGQEYLITHNTDDSRGWKYVYMYPIAQVRQTLIRQSQFMLLVCAALFLLSFLLASRVARLAARPADRLINLVRERTAGGDSGLGDLHAQLTRHFSDSEGMKKQLKEAMGAMRDRLLINLLNSIAFDEEKTAQGFIRCGIDLPNDHLMIGIIALGADRAEDDIVYDLTGIAALPVIEDYIRHAGVRCACVAGAPGEVAIILDALNRRPDEMAALLKTVLDRLNEAAGARGWAALYDLPFPLAQTHNAYLKARSAMDYRRLYDQGEVISFSDIHDRHDSGYCYAYDKEAALCNCIRAGDLKESIGALNRMIEIFSRLAHLNQANIMLFNINLYNGMMRFAYEQNLPVEFISAYSDKAAQVQRLKSLDESHCFFERMIREAIGIMESSRQSRMARYTQTISCYIADNFMCSDLSLEKLSAEIGISVSYINQILKGRTGKTFNQLLTDKRIAMACRLLAESEMKVQDIAMRVGYSSANYFARAFKGTMGITPGQYREGSKG